MLENCGMIMVSDASTLDFIPVYLSAHECPHNPCVQTIPKPGPSTAGKACVDLHVFNHDDKSREKNPTGMVPS